MIGVVPRLALVAVLALLAPALSVHAEEEKVDFRKLDLTGDWYVLIHFKDDRSEDETIVKFKDMAWSIEQTQKALTWEEYPFVVFPEEQELERRHAMMNHLNWEPGEDFIERVKEQSLDVSSRASTRKELTGTRAEGFRSQAPLASGGLNTLTFSRTWTVDYAPERVRVVVVDSLSGAAALDSLEGATVYKIDTRTGDGELGGSFDAETKHGRFRMIRAAERKVVK